MTKKIIKEELNNFDELLSNYVKDKYISDSVCKNPIMRTLTLTYDGIINDLNVKEENAIDFIKESIQKLFNYHYLLDDNNGFIIVTLAAGENITLELLPTCNNV